MKYRWLLIEDYGDMLGTNDEEVMKQHLSYSNYRVVDVVTGEACHEDYRWFIKDETDEQ